MDNDLIPNDSEALGVYEPAEPEERQQAQRTEDSVIASATPIIEELLTWFNAQVAVCDSVTQARATAKTYGLTIEQAIAAHDIIGTLLKSKRSELAGRFEAHMKRNEDGPEE